MYFRKWPHPANFEFVQTCKSGNLYRVGETPVRLDITSYQGDIYRVRARSALWKKNYSQAELQIPPKGTGSTCLQVHDRFGLRLRDASGATLLSSPPGLTFGVSGHSSMFLFEHDPDYQFYGMGEKMLGLELSGVQTKFWNTDVFADFNWEEISRGRPDPLYASVPYVVIKRGNTYLGLLLDNPYATFISTGAGINIANQMNLGEPARKVVMIGGENGQPDLYIIVGPTLVELTRKLQKLVGLTPLPPAWALGYQQCRWGYKSEEDLRGLDENFRRHEIPCDGLWLDIDYMVDFKVFTINKKLIPKARKLFADLARKGRRVVPIFDPGVKRQPGYDVYEDGRKRKVFCRNPQGRDFVGLVWPGETVFPDFSLARTRGWWADWVAKFARQGITGAWIDMNDPSTGSVQNDAMLFDGGRHGHDMFHNQYALGMAKATREGFRQAHPGKRPFVITRSAFTGISKHSAVWTGDNVSSYHYLKASVPVSLNLALSGVPFNGPDIGGFACDTRPQLLCDWMKTCFLFPFCRNHTAVGTVAQEPWAFDQATLDLMRHYIRLRYKLRPYLYNLFVRQELDGDAILRPLFYDFDDSAELPLGRIDDQFMIGPLIMQAPILDEQQRAREVVLPGPDAWYSVMDAKWLIGHRKTAAAPEPMQTPLYIRAGALLPMAAGEPRDNAWNPAQLECHVFLPRNGRRTVFYDYAYDDGETEAYRKGKRSTLRMEATADGSALSLSHRLLDKGYGPARVSYVLYDRFDSVQLNGQPVQPAAARWTFAGTEQDVWRIEA